MPTITKQNAKPKAASKNGSVLDRIAPVRESDVGVRMAVYGRTKTGKTRLACTFPKPLLLIGAEDGTKSIHTVKGVDFVRLERSEEVFEISESLRDGKYKTAVLDTATSLYEMIIPEILGLGEVKSRQAWGRASKDDWTQGAIQMKEHLWKLLRLSELNGMSVVVLAQEKNSREEAGDSSDLITPTVGPAVSASVATFLKATCDYVVQTFIREQTVERQAPMAGGKSSLTLRQPTGRNEYCLRLQTNGVYEAGFRQPPGGELPETLVNADYAKIRALIDGD